MIEQGDDVSSGEFTFPTVADDSSLCHLQFPGFPSSPLWYAAAEEKALDKISDEESQGSLVHTEFGSGDGGVYIEKEEKMDMLWEHLNEELSNDQEGKKIASVLPLSKSSRLEPRRASAAEMEDCRQIESLKILKRNSMKLHGKKSLMVMFKILRKLLLLHNSTYQKKV